MRQTSATLSAPELVVASCGEDRDRAVRVREMLQGEFDFVWRLLRRLGVDEADVDDAAQRVFIVASQKLDKIEAGSERTFLFSTALRVASASRRDAGRRREDFGAEIDDRVAPTLAPDEAAARRQGLAMLDAAIAKVPEALRVVFVLSELEELSDPEIARLLGVPVGTVASRLRRAREAFRDAVRVVLAARSKRRPP